MAQIQRVFFKIIVLLSRKKESFLLVNAALERFFKGI